MPGSDSLEAQDGRLRAYVESQDGWELVRSFTDQLSGASLERPGLRRALSEARAARFDLLLVYRVDRRQIHVPVALAVGRGRGLLLRGRPPANRVRCRARNGLSAARQAVSDRATSGRRCLCSIIPTICGCAIRGYWAAGGAQVSGAICPRQLCSNAWSCGLSPAAVNVTSRSTPSSVALNAPSVVVP